MRVKQISGMPMINDNRGASSLRLVDNYPNNLNKTIADSLYCNINFSPVLKVQPNHAPQQSTSTKATDALLTMRVSIFNNALVMMKRILLRIWSFTKSTIFFVWAVFKFMYSALEFMVLFIKFLFTQKHWSN